MLDRALNPTFTADSYYFSMRLIAMKGPQADPFTFKISIQKGIQRADNTKGVYNMEGTECSLNDEFLNFNVPVYNPNRPIEFTANMTDENLGVYTSFPINPGKLITEFINSGKNTFQETTAFEDPTYELEYVIYVQKSRAALLNLIRTTTELQITSPLNSPLKRPDSADNTPNKRTVTPQQRQPTPKASEPRTVEKKEEPVPEPQAPELPAETKQNSLKKALTPTKIQRRNETITNQEVPKVEIARTESNLISEPNSASKTGSRQASGTTLSSSKQKVKQPEPDPEPEPEQVAAQPEEVKEEPKPEPPKSTKTAEKKIQKSTQKVRKVEQPAPPAKVEAVKPQRQETPAKKEQKTKQPAPAIEKKVEAPAPKAKVQAPAPVTPAKQPAKKTENPTEKSAQKIGKPAVAQEEPKGNNKIVIIAIVVAALLFGFFFLGGSKAGKAKKGSNRIRN